MIGDAAGAVKDFAVNVWGTATDFTESAGNWIAHGDFLNDAEYNFLYGSNVNEFYNPLKAKPKSFFKDEVDYLESAGYIFRQNNRWTWEAY